jgi:hypothetical protein
MTTPDFGAFFLVYKNPLATYKCLESFRRFYPNNSIVLISDNGYNYTEMAKHFNCIYMHCDEQLWLIYEDIEDIKLGINGKQLQWVNKLLKRLYSGFSQIKEEYFIWLEDDVVINRKVNDKLLCDINGYNPNVYHNSILQQLNKKYPIIDVNKRYTWSGGGGSIFCKKNIMKYMENTNIISDVVINWTNYQLTSNIVCDFLLSLITNVNGGTIGPCNRVADGYRNEISPHLDVQHQYKRYYGIDLPEELALLVDKLPKDNIF